MRAAAVGLSPKSRVDSGAVRGDAATPSWRSVRVVTLSFLDESEDDVPGEVTCGALLAGGCTEGALAGGGVVVV